MVSNISWIFGLGGYNMGDVKTNHSIAPGRAAFLAGTLAVCFTEGLVAAAPEAVAITRRQIEIPTYRLGLPDPNPIFYAQESYQGAQKRVYPYALQDQLTHELTNQVYTLLSLENEYLKLGVLPEIGGRLFEAVDKSNNYDFFYRQHVIKPALIGMLGAWISGGVEFCCFHHHRNTTFMPVDYTLAENADGSKTIWFGEIERRHRMKWLVGITLYPGKSYLETTVKFFNRTPLPNSILYWANVAVHVNDDYQVIFPPSVDLATYHSKVDFVHGPLADGRYQNFNYQNADISWWKNHPKPVSCFAWDLREDFMGGYDHGKEAGVVHVADHHFVGGAKLWEWSPGTEGRMWDKILTDTDGPYAELMVGAWSDNQPDYSWIKPGEVKVIKQYWYPVRDIGGFKKANLNGAVNLEVRTNQTVLLGFQTTSRQTGATVTLQARGQVVFQTNVTVAPGTPFRRALALPAGLQATDLRAVLASSQGEELVAYQPAAPKLKPDLPAPVQPPPPPKDLKTVEELYLTGLRVEQIHNPTVSPLAYYEEAVRRDPGDTRAHTALGMNLLKQGRYPEAEQHLRTALVRLTAAFTRAMNGDAHYYLGLALRAQGRLPEAMDQFHRASWDVAFHSAAFNQAAELSCLQGDYLAALGQLDRSLATGQWQTKTWDLRAAVLRRLGHAREALAAAAHVLAEDPLDFLARNERQLALRDLGQTEAADQALRELNHQLRDEVQSCLEMGVDYLNAGLYDEALGVLRQAAGSRMAFTANHPLVHYYLGYLQQQKGDVSQALRHYQEAATKPADYCFPFRLETATVLREALRANPTDARAWLYLGNLYYDLQPEPAMECWQKARNLDGRLALVHRNLGWGYQHFHKDLTNAVAAYEKAIEYQSTDPRWFVELDSLYETANVDPARRLALLEKHHGTVVARKETLTRLLAVQVLCGQYDSVIGQLAANFFHVREGGGEIHDIFVDAQLLKGLQLLRQKRFEGALAHFNKAAEYPENLSVGRPKNDRRAAQVAYHRGLASAALGRTAEARDFFAQAAGQKETDPWPEARFYQALSMVELGQAEAAARIFDRLVEEGSRQLKSDSGADFFAKFGEQETRQARKAAAHFTRGLGWLGKGQAAEAREAFAQAVQLNASQVWAKHQLEAAR